MNILKEFYLNDKCSYLDNQEQNLHYTMIDNCSSSHCQNLIERGYRRFGKMFFRPICSECNECQSIKVDVDNFNFSKSMRRVIKKGSHIKSYIQQPTLSQEHLALFKKYHLFMKDKKDWTYNETSANHYYDSFVNGHNNFGYEVLYFDEEKLIGVDLIDILDDGISSIYFYYDPDYMDYSLGKLSLYNQIKIAKNNNMKWIYLGYYVKDCPSLSYKSHYKPYITLEGRPNIDENFKWL
ncbi:MAG: arginyltransferase [Campylobacterota bacterium]|nr:arginyltransferase [Campylobacterota bacterium]